MSKELTITIPDDVYLLLDEQAKSLGTYVAEVVQELLIDYEHEPRFAVHPRRAEMEREEAAYVAMHSELWLKYPNQYVAVYQGKVVDRGEDIVSLMGRIDETYPDEIVLVTKVEREPARVLRDRSIRFAHNR